MEPADLVTVILCGGRGTRAWPLTAELPKPLLPVAGRPIVEHVIGIYARRGVRRFVLATGYLGAAVAEHFAVPRPHQVEDHWGELELRCVDTGEDTPTGERLRRVAPEAGQTFLATYADGLADVDLGALLRAHEAHGRLATVTTVPLPSQYGTLEIDDGGIVRGFREKPRLMDHWINAGYFVFRAEAFRRHAGADLEVDVLPSLAAAGELGAHRHSGFWRSADTHKDIQALDGLAREVPLRWL